MSHYNSLEPETKKRNVVSWRPVVIQILDAFVNFDDVQFDENIPGFYGQMIDLLLHDLAPDIRQALHSVLKRVGNRLLR